MKMKGADIITDYLVKENVPYAVGVCGHGIVGLLDSLHERSDKIKTISVRHEQAAGYIADAYYRVKHEPIVTFTSCGPGSTNMVTPLAGAYMDSSAFLSISGNVPTCQFNRGPFQETGRYFQGDFPSVIRSYVKKSFQPTRVEMVPLAVRQAFKEMTNGKPGPVNLDVPFNVFQEEGEAICGEPQDYRWNMDQRPQGNPETIRKAVEMLAAAERPLIVAGYGAILSEAGKEMVNFASYMKIPVHTSPMGKGIIDETHPLCLGPTGRNGAYAANEAGKSCDVLLALGTSFDDRSTSAWLDGYTYSMNTTKVIHVDIDPREIGRNYPFALGIIGDVKLVLQQLLQLAKEQFADKKPDYSAWHKRIEEWKSIWYEYKEPLLNSNAQPIRPERVIGDIRKVLPKNGIFLTDVGVHHNWVVQFWDTYEAQTILQAWGFAAMGFATCGVIGAKLAAPERTAVALCGDGSFMMTPHILATAVEYNIPAVWVIFNNFAYGSIRDLQLGYFGGRELATSFIKEETGELYNPDFVALAKAFGVKGTRIEKPEDLADAVEYGIKLNQPYVVEVIVDRDIKPIGTGTWVLPPFKHPEPNFKPGR
ncbi:thiamine pyrophosphate-binding protein [Desulfitibacter alkalitolerans]|uniref:thiamine pyrophosphate-binding protein n=1 Tax=Desulfitibacter alkalitolerans TaxID=264641 RepID=UPI0005570CFC|nr:thiamine pyrophosphate-binding protein [Desulfitibacter alkalitolerans]